MLYPEDERDNYCSKRQDQSGSFQSQHSLKRELLHARAQVYYFFYSLFLSQHCLKFPFNTSYWWELAESLRNLDLPKGAI